MEAGQVPEEKETIAGKFNYGKVSFDPSKVFDEYDEDQSGTIDEDELEEAVYQLGISLEFIDDIKAQLGMTKEGSVCKRAGFIKWWNSDGGPSHMANVTQALMEKVSKEVQRVLIPMIKALFAEADADKGGTLTEAEFEAFYPELEAACGYKLPPIERIISIEPYDQHDPKNYLHVDPETGIVGYDEFQLWFLENERLRAIGSDLGKRTIRMNKVDLQKLRASFGDNSAAGKVVIKPIQRQSSRDKMSYAEINPDAAAVFATFDADKSGDIDVEELTNLLYALGMRLTDEAIATAKEELEIEDDSAKGVELGSFVEWWDAGPGAAIKEQAALIDALPPVYKSTHMPKMKELFSNSDADRSGALDRPEFEVFYRELGEYLKSKDPKHKLPPIIQTMGELPSFWSKEPQVEFSEWSKWFLDYETKRAAGTL